MYASHWSYGQRCGLGSIETDLLVNWIRRSGESAGIHGAKISGRGCGGVVTVLMDATEPARLALDQAVRHYQQQSGHTPSILRGAVDGAWHTGVIRA